jgi:hypothetical protein
MVYIIVAVKIRELASSFFLNLNRARGSIPVLPQTRSLQWHKNCPAAARLIDITNKSLDLCKPVMDMKCKHNVYCV